MRIVYGVVTTGMGHVARLLALLPLFRRDGHELLVILSGPGAGAGLPTFVTEALHGIPFIRYTGLQMIEDGEGGISKRKTLKSFATNLPTFFDELRQAHRVIADYDPDLIINDFDPITGSPFVAPGVPKVGIGNHAAQKMPSAPHVPGQTLKRWNVDLVAKLSTSGVDTVLGCHFYPIDQACLPPILRPRVLSMETENRGHLLVYHSFVRMFEPLRTYAAQHPNVPIIAYGYDHPPRGAQENIHFETDSTRFLEDLSTCDAYIGTAGFQSISEAFYLGKKIVVQPIEGHYEQIWNASQVEEHGMGRRCRGNLAEALDQEFDAELHRRLVPWYGNGPQLSYERLLSYAPGI